MCDLWNNILHIRKFEGPILQKHETEIVEKNKELITCSQCVKSFSKNATLKRHMKEYHNVENEQK